MSKFPSIVALAVLCSIAQAQSHPTQTPPPSSSTTQSEKDSKTSKSASTAPADYAKEAFVIEQSKTSYRFETDGTSTKTVSGRYKVQSDAALQRLGQLMFGYNSENERLRIDYVRVQKSDGTVVTAPESAVQDLTSQVAREAPVYSDYREKHVTVPSLRPGEVLEFQITTETFRPLAPGQFWMDYSFEKNAIVLAESLEVNLPRNRQLKMKVKPEYETVQSDEGDRHIYRWSHKNLERPDDEKKLSRAAISKRLKDLEKADIQLTTFASWDEMAKWYSGLEKDRRIPNDAVKAKAESLTQGKQTPLEKVEAIYDYVATNFRYVSLSFGTGRYQPHAAADVFAAQYGDCKDKETLLAAMLNSVGISTNSVLIHSQRKLDEDIPSPSQFDHVIGAVQLGDKLVWVDTTSEIAPFQVLLPALRGKSALLITPQGAGRIEKTPATLPFDAFQRVEMTGKVTELGKLDVHVSYETRGDLEVGLRLAFRRVPESRWTQFLEYANSMEGLQGDISNVKVSNPAATKSPLIVQYDLAQANFLDISSKSSKLSLPLPPTRLEYVDDEDADSDEPIKLGSAIDVRTTLKLTFPEKYKLSMPLPVSLKREYGEFASTYKFQDSVLTVTRHVKLNVPELPVSKRSDLKSFNRVLRTDTEQRIGVEGTGEEVASAPAGTKAADLDEAARAAFNARNYKLSATLYKRVVELEPKHKTAWNNLGRAYLNQFELDDAIAAFKKQIEINPYDEWSYNNLGLAYDRQQKYEDAIASFRKQIEINPLDRYAHRNLGLLFVRRHRYEEAIPELNQALVMHPDDLFLQQQLADAYLESGQTDKAIEMFDAVVKKMPAPPTWNNVAYALAEKGVSLDRARQYAESAVSMTASAIRNLPDDQLRESGAAATAVLATYWDTLGWVYFRQGDLDKGEKFIYAAWQHAQHGEVGDHLAQLYEKRGQKQKAIDMYAKAMAATAPVPETRGRLAKLLGGDAKVDPLVDKMRPVLSADRTVRLGPQKLGSGAPKKDGLKAEFLLVFGQSAKLEGVRFLNGTDSLKPITDKLKSMKYPVAAPDDSALRIVRKAVMWCSQPTIDCTLVLEPAGEQAQLNAPIPGSVLNVQVPSSTNIPDPESDGDDAN